MMRAEKIAGDINEANELLSGGAAPMPVLTGLVRRLERKSAEAPGLLEPVVSALDRAIDALGEAQDGLEAVIRESDFDPRVLERAEERLFALRAAGAQVLGSRRRTAGAARPHGLPISPTSMPAPNGSALMERQAAEARALYDHAAAELSEARRARGAGARRPPSWPNCRRSSWSAPSSSSRSQSDPERPGPRGHRHGGILGADQSRHAAGPMMKVASGGELSRFLLALKVALADRGSAPTLVFDEIDTGVGGAVADAIGQRLARLAERVQVLSVTHAPQVAARADTHFLISKDAHGEEHVRTSVAAIARAERQEEIARMLAGATITDGARAAAAAASVEREGGRRLLSGGRKRVT